MDRRRIVEFLLAAGGLLACDPGPAPPSTEDTDLDASPDAWLLRDAWHPHAPDARRRDARPPPAPDAAPEYVPGVCGRNPCPPVRCDDVEVSPAPAGLTCDLPDTAPLDGVTKCNKPAQCPRDPAEGYPEPSRDGQRCIAFRGCSWQTRCANESCTLCVDEETGEITAGDDNPLICCFDESGNLGYGFYPGEATWEVRARHDAQGRLRAYDAVVPYDRGSGRFYRCRRDYDDAGRVTGDHEAWGDSEDSLIALSSICLVYDDANQLVARREVYSDGRYTRLAALRTDTCGPLFELCSTTVPDLWAYCESGRSAWFD